MNLLEIQRAFWIINLISSDHSSLLSKSYVDDHVATLGIIFISPHKFHFTIIPKNSVHLSQPLLEKTPKYIHEEESINNTNSLLDGNEGFVKAPIKKCQYTLLSSCTATMKLSL